MSPRLSRRKIPYSGRIPLRALSLSCKDIVSSTNLTGTYVPRNISEDRRVYKCLKT